MWKSVCCFILLFVALPFVFGDLENANAQRVLDLSTQLVRETATILIQNNGASEVSEYKFIFEDFEHVAYFEAKSKKSGVLLTHTFEDDKKTGSKVAKVLLDSPLEKDGKLTVVFTIVSTHQYQAYPKEIKQNDPQLFLYSGNLYFYSLYPTLKLKVSYLLPSDQFESYTNTIGATLAGNKISYGPNTEKVEPLSKKEFKVHFPNNGVFLTVEKLLRTLEISHWGSNLAIEEFYDVIHSGALLKGFYSRLDFDMSQHNHHNTQVIKQLNFNLPVGATDVYYRDIIGNISTSHFRSSPFESVLELSPRYPLFGGWRTKWYHGYNLPLQNSMKIAADGTYILEFLFVAPFEDAVIDDFTLQVTLPEGATDIQFRSENNLFIEETFSKVQTYLDTYGRPVFIAKKKNVAGNHQVLVQITYRFPTHLMLQEPLLLIVFFFTLFLFGMIFVRIDLSISKDPNAEKRDLSQSTWNDVLQKEDEKKEIFKELNDAIEKFKKSKELPVFEGKKKQLDTSLQSKNQELTAIQAKLKLTDAPRAAKIDEIIRISKDKWSKLSKLHSDMISVITGKSSNKKSVQNSVQDVNKEIQNLDAKLDSILDD